MAIFGAKKEYRDGDKVACQQCGKQTEVKWFASKQSALVPPGEREKLALRCQSCGFITCSACAHPGDSMFPVCPNCKKEWGPYYFIGGGAQEGGGEENSDESEGRAAARAMPNANWEQALRMELPPMEELNTETGSAPAKSNRMSGSPLALLLFLLVGILVAAIVFAVLRVPGITMALKGILPAATPTPFVLGGDLREVTDGQLVAMIGQIEPPQSRERCENDENDITWCRAVIYLEDSTAIDLWARQGKQVNALTDNLEFLDNDGTLVLNGSQVRIEGLADCEEGLPCQIRVQKIQAVSLATRKPTPTVEQMKTATKKPTRINTATAMATETISSTASGNASASASPTTESISGCRDALQITLDDLGKEDVCVQGIVREYFKDDVAELLFFDQTATSFAFVSYGPPLNFAPGTCVFGTGKVAQLGARPAIVVTYKALVEKCP
ncbi:MAG: hypothetical protein ACOYYS_21625 [Chloroflexota bacterium]